MKKVISVITNKLGNFKVSTMKSISILSNSRSTKQLKKNKLIRLKNNLLFKVQQLIKHKSRIKIVHPKRKPRQMLDSLKK